MAIAQAPQLPAHDDADASDPRSKVSNSENTSSHVARSHSYSRSTGAGTRSVTPSTSSGTPQAHSREWNHVHVSGFYELGQSKSSSISDSSHEGATSPKLRKIKADVVKTVLWIIFAAAVAAFIGVWKGRSRAIEFVTGYIVEYSLSVDNLFVFMLIFKYFRVPRDAQERVLFWGILGAMVLRGIMIVLGKALTERFTWVTIGFAIVLLYTAVKLLLENDDDDDDLDNNKIVRFSKRVIPVSDQYMSDRFFVKQSNRVLATPLLVVLISIELSDVVFATDSVPAVLGISNDALVIYASNICAVMGLRSLYFIVADAISNIRFLKQALAAVLCFIGLKMLAASLIGFEFDGVLSLFVVVFALALGIICSFIWPAPETKGGAVDGENSAELLSLSGSAERV